MKIRFCLLASASTVALASGGAHAADLALKSSPLAAPASWAGWYVGINGGVITTQTTINDPDRFSQGYLSTLTQKKTGGLAGGQIGYNWQDDALVYGLEADFDGVFGTKTNTFLAVTPGIAGSGAQVQSRWDWLSTIRGRAGITVGARQGTLLYVTGGLALAEAKANWGAGVGATPSINTNTFTSNDVKVGWTAGAGIEHMFAGLPNWSIRAEALWVQLENNTASNPGPGLFGQTSGTGTFHSEFQNEAVLVRLGLNHRF